MKTLKMPLGMIVVNMLKPMFCVLEMRAAKQTGLKLTMPQFVLLFKISEEKEEVTLKDMAEKLGKDKSAILRMIDLLEEKELLRRVVDIKDRRKNQILVTKKGEKAIEDHLQMELALNKEFFNGLTEAEIDAFYKVLEHIRTRAEQL